jgi:hypothetical protein
MHVQVEYAAQPPIAAPRVELQDFLRRAFEWMFLFLPRIFGRTR